MRKFAMALGAVSLVAAPVAAESFRVDTPVEDASELEGNSTIFALLGAAAVIAGIIILASDDDSVSA